MNANDLIKKIQSERQRAESEVADSEGLERLQDVLQHYDGEYRLIWSESLIERLKEQPRPSGHKTGLEGLDAILGGFREQQVVSVAAATAHGKSAYGMFLAHQMEALSPVVIPIEQTAEELIAQRMENGHTIPRFLSPERLAELVTVDWIEERVVEGIAKYNTKFVVIDHLGYIDNSSKHPNENLAYRLGMVMKGLKNIAKRWNVVVVILVHISQHDEGKPPSLVDVGYSSDINKESDTVILLWRKNRLSKKIRVYDDKTLVSVQKNRFSGKNGNVGMVFDRTTGLFTEDNEWVESMERTAQQEVAAEDEFENF